MISGDVILYFMGRVSGWALLGLLCRLSANPETCILRSAEYFYRRGKLTLLFAKFIPGINTMSPPLAGSMKMRLRDFLQFDAIGAALYVGAYSVAGYLFSDALRAITRGLRSAGFAAEVVFGIGLAAYVVYRIWVYRKYRLLDVIPRIPARGARQKTGVRCGSEHADRGCPQPRLLRCRLRTHCRIDPHRTQQPRLKRSRTCPRIERFISTALERAKPRAPGWRTNCRNSDSKCSSSPAACAPGARLDTRWNEFPTTTWSSCQPSVKRIVLVVTASLAELQQFVIVPIWGGPRLFAE